MPTDRVVSRHVPPAGSTPAERTFALDRFAVSRDGGEYLFRDRLQAKIRRLPVTAFAGLDGAKRDLAWIRKGLMSPCLDPVPERVADRPRNVHDALFWQFPCRTEGAARDLHANLAEAPEAEGCVHCYLALPWATLLDKRRLDISAIGILRVRTAGLRRALGEAGARLRVHTVCQHIGWRRLASLWQSMGITDAWLAHAPPLGSAEAGALPFELHPWHLYAVNFEDPQRRAGLQPGKDPADRSLMASFIGAHMGHYLSDIRLRLRSFAGRSGFHIRVNDDWHFNPVVYAHQVGNAPLSESYRIDESVTEYNRVLSDSRFALCPSGAGPNTLRLWEALAVGSVPVLLGRAPRLPEGGSLRPIDWEAIVVRVADDQLANLPELLRRMPLEDVRRRQRLGMHAYASVREQRCFG